MPERDPHIVVLSSLFPSAIQPGAGLFVRERMFRVGRQLPLTVVSPVPWFPLQGWVRRARAGFRPGAPAFERQSGFDVWYPRFFSVPGFFKSLDGLMMALGAFGRLRALKRQGRLDHIDAHFAYPDGYAASLLGRWLRVPVTITLRGSEARQARDAKLAPRLRQALAGARRVFAVSASLGRVAVELGLPRARLRVVGNGVDLEKFTPVRRSEARSALGIDLAAPVIVGVGGLVERKGFHRVIEVLTALRQRHSGLVYLVVGGPSPEGDLSRELQAQVRAAGLEDAVRFLGALPPERLTVPLSAADVFVLATRNEGWANVFLEAMACGLPVVTTDVGGNAEVVCRPDLGILLPFGDSLALEAALDTALRRSWDREAIRRHAAANTWDERVRVLVEDLRALHAEAQSNGPRASVDPQAARS